MQRDAGISQFEYMVLSALSMMPGRTLRKSALAEYINPYLMLATTNAAQAALRNWVLNLGKATAGTGIYAANVAVNVFIGANPPAEGVPHAHPDDIAKVYWDLHIQRSQPEHVVTG